MAIRTPAEVFPPGDFLREELEARGWTQADLAGIIGRDAAMISQIVQGKRGITPETALGLAAAFGTSPEFWMRLEQAYQLGRVKNTGETGIVRRARLYSLAPIADMVRRGWIEPTDDVDVLEQRLLKFYDVGKLEDSQNVFAHAARKGTSYDTPSTPAQIAWLVRARNLARVLEVAPFRSDSVAKALAELRLLIKAPEEGRHVARVLANNGIRFVIVEPLAGTKIDGACFWIDGSPVIALSVRYNRMDNFWFTLLHELGHCSQRQVSFDVELDTRRSNMDKPAEERFADEFALKSLVEPKDLDGFIARKRPLYSTQSIIAFALTKGVHPGIVVGQLQYRGELKWEYFRKMLVPIRDHVIGSSLVDGWGAHPPA